MKSLKELKKMSIEELKEEDSKFWDYHNKLKAIINYKELEVEK